MKCFEWPGEVENKIEWFEAQASLPFRAALGLRIVVREREDGLGISIGKVPSRFLTIDNFRFSKRPTPD